MLGIVCIEDTKIVCICANVQKDGEYDILSQDTVPFDGLKKGNTLGGSGIALALNEAIELAEEGAGSRIKQLHVGVPGCFCQVQITSPNAYAMMEEDSFAVEREIYLDDEYELIHRVQLPQQRGEGGRISSIQASREYISQINGSLKRAGLRPASYVSQQYAQGLYVIPAAERNHVAIMLDVEYYNTDVSVFYGNAQVYQVTLRVGGGHICSDLMQVLEIERRHAETLKSQFVFGLEASEGELDYVRLDNGKLQGYEHALIDEVVRARVDEMSALIASSLEYSEYYPEGEGRGYLIGEGFTEMRGAKEYVGAALGLRMEGLPLDMVDGTTRTSLSALSMLDYVARRERGSNTLLDKMKQLRPKRLFQK